MAPSPNGPIKEQFPKLTMLFPRSITKTNRPISVVAFNHD